MVRVIPLGEPHKIILMTAGCLIRQGSNEFVWVIGASKWYIKNELGLQVFGTCRLNMYTYAFKVDRKAYHEYLIKNRFPQLEYHM